MGREHSVTDPYSCSDEQSDADSFHFIPKVPSVLGVWAAASLLLLLRDLLSTFFSCYFPGVPQGRVWCVVIAKHTLQICVLFGFHEFPCTWQQSSSERAFCSEPSVEKSFFQFVTWRCMVGVWPGRSGWAAVAGSGCWGDFWHHFLGSLQLHELRCGGTRGVTAGFSVLPASLGQYKATELQVFLPAQALFLCVMLFWSVTVVGESDRCTFVVQ